MATVANINWPSAPGLSESDQKSEAIALLDLLKKCNYNAVIFQVRPQADALYISDLEPWSYYLTGEQGVAPDNFYDPLEFWVDEAHKRNLELHTWINPYIAHYKDGSLVSEYSIANKNPELVVKLKEGYWWFDPSLEETQDHSYMVVMDIARRYDIDGIHFDDFSTKWLGNINLSKNSFKNAIHFFNESLLLNSNDAQVYYNLAAAYLNINNFKEALKSIRNCIKLKPNYPNAVGMEEQLVAKINNDGYYPNEEFYFEIE